MAREISVDGYSEWITVVPSDTLPLLNHSDALWVTGAGTLTFDDTSGRKSTLTVAVSTAYPLPVRANKIYATGTTATIIALRK